MLQDKYSWFSYKITLDNIHNTQGGGISTALSQPFLYLLAVSAIWRGLKTLKDKGTPPPCKMDSSKPCPSPALQPFLYLLAVSAIWRGLKTLKTRILPLLARWTRPNPAPPLPSSLFCTYWLFQPYGVDLKL